MQIGNISNLPLPGLEKNEAGRKPKEAATLTPPDQIGLSAAARGSLNLNEKLEASRRKASVDHKIYTLMNDPLMTDQKQAKLETKLEKLLRQDEADSKAVSQVYRNMHRLTNDRLNKKISEYRYLRQMGMLQDELITASKQELIDQLQENRQPQPVSLAELISVTREPQEEAAGHQPAPQAHLTAEDLERGRAVSRRKASVDYKISSLMNDPAMTDEKQAKLETRLETMLKPDKVDGKNSSEIYQRMHRLTNDRLKKKVSEYRYLRQMGMLQSDLNLAVRLESLERLTGQKENA